MTAGSTEIRFTAARCRRGLPGGPASPLPGTTAFVITLTVMRRMIVGLHQADALCIQFKEYGAPVGPDDILWASLLTVLQYAKVIWKLNVPFAAAAPTVLRVWLVA